MTGLWGLALADFRERVRRPAYALMLLSAIGLGWLAVPARDAHWVVLDAGGYRGVYTSAYVGLVTALTSALWLTFVGFYLARDAVARDERTGVGRLLAATPLRSGAYLAGKFLSNLLLLGSMAAVLAVTALALQLLRGESRAVDLAGLLTPFVLLALPMLAVTAAAAVLFETTPVLRGGFGNVLWCFVWMVGAVAGQSPDAPLGGIGMAHVTASMAADLAGRSPAPEAPGLGLMFVDTPLRTFEWSGLPLTAPFVGGRVALTALAVGLALLPALWFHRFDRPAASGRSVHSGPEPRSVYRGLPQTVPSPGATGVRLFQGELRILLQGTPLWWWLGAGLLAVVSLVVPPGLMLAAVWIWPILLWSRLGTQHTTSGVAAILAACPATRGRLLAEWAAGVALAALTGAGAAVRMAVIGDAAGLLAWAGGALFIPALALTLGTVTGAPRMFQAVYTILWYLMINNLPALDVMGALRDHGEPRGPSPVLVTGLGLAGVAVSFAVTTLRHARR
ncbi:hypothetical protein GCM10010399_22900 [Dactylosporangium fulvum]|uniref:ABC transporter permease n=1 Tax=Dactylosporangium fulvum TaxID=53359 RepID=A0ABY5VY43_9ACTN|nr:hypothetical protein [Dactylosporangium fulvum]UWP82197.1 hypothetical protein Dfulv_45245 [Dactylosporangium fulvum]